MEICLLRQVLRRLVYAAELKWIITGGSLVLGIAFRCKDIGSVLGLWGCKLTSIWCIQEPKMRQSIGESLQTPFFSFWMEVASL